MFTESDFVNIDYLLLINHLAMLCLDAGGQSLFTIKFYSCASKYCSFFLFLASLSHMTKKGCVRVSKTIMTSEAAGMN